MINAKNNRRYKHQTNYFNLEFSKNRIYKLFEWHNSYIRRIKEHLLKRNFKGKTLLDIGAGSGYVTIEMAKIGLKVVSLDLSKTALDNINRYKNKFNLKNIITMHSNAEKIPLKNQSADYIVANAILEHLPNEKQAIYECKRILKPGGRIMVTVPLKYRYVWPFLWPVNYIHDRQIGHLRRYDLQDLENKFTMKVIVHFYTGHLIKALWIIYSVLFNSNMFDEQIEIIDGKGKHKRYGASNIVVFFEK